MNQLPELLTVLLLGLVAEQVQSKFEFEAVIDPRINGIAQCHNQSALFNVTSGLANAAHPPSLKISRIWCSAKERSRKNKKISGGAFWKLDTKEKFEGIIETYGREGLLRLTLEVANANFSHLGKYRCDLYVDGQIKHYYASDFLQINMRPVFVFNSTSGYKMADKDRFTVFAPKTWAVKDEAIELRCPVVAYPPPERITWYKEGSSGELVANYSASSADQVAERISVMHNGSLIIRKLVTDDTGIYVCVVENRVVLQNGTNVFKATLTYDLTVKGHYLWVLPLIIIAVMAVLLFVIIYGCGIIKRCRTYNVEKRERRQVVTSDIAAKSAGPKANEPMLSYNKNEIDH